MNTLTLNKVLLNARPLNMKKRIVKDKDFYYKVLDREFSFSITAGGKRIKSSTATITRLKGNSVVWNNIAEWRGVGNTNYGITVTFDNGYIHVQGVVENTAIPFYSVLYDDASKSGIFIKNHRYMVSGKGDKFYLSIYGDVSITGPNVITEKTGETVRLTISSQNLTIGEEINETFPIRVVDLTQMFGSGNEPTTIEEFNARKPIVEDEFAYNEGEVIHMTAEGINSVGDNAWDEEWEIGAIDYNSGVDVAVTSKCRNRGFVKVLPNEEYYLSSPSFGELSSAVVICYDENKQFMNHIGGGSANARFTIPSDCHYIRFTWVGTTYNHDIMITLVHSGWKQDTDAGYQPYWEDRLIFDQRIKDEFPNGMSKWDMVYNKDGKGYIVKGLGVVDLGSLNGWYLGGGGAYWAAVQGSALPTSRPVNGDTVAQVVCKRYVATDWHSVYRGVQGAIGVYTDGQIGLVDTAITSVEDIPAALAGVLLYYQLAEPTIIEYDEPFNLDYKVADFGTEQAIAEQPSAPISAEIGYHILKNNLELTLNS